MLASLDGSGGEAGEASGLIVGGDAKASLEGSRASVGAGIVSVLLPSSAVIEGGFTSAV